MSIELDTLTALRSWRSATIDHLTRAVGCSRREMEQAIETLRLEGFPIIAGAAGVSLTDDPHELERYIEARRRRLVSQYQGTRALRAALRKMRDEQARAEGLTLWRNVA